jgi:hypothetical protein
MMLPLKDKDFTTATEGNSHVSRSCDLHWIIHKSRRREALDGLCSKLRITPMDMGSGIASGPGIQVAVPLQASVGVWACAAAATLPSDYQQGTFGPVHPLPSHSSRPQRTLFGIVVLRRRMKIADLRLGHFFVQLPLISVPSKLINSPLGDARRAIHS